MTKKTKGEWRLVKKNDGSWEAVREIVCTVASKRQVECETVHTLRQRRKLGALTREGAEAAFRAFLATKEAR